MELDWATLLAMLSDFQALHLDDHSALSLESVEHSWEEHEWVEPQLVAKAWVEPCLVAKQSVAFP
jgi:hypothetical protein